MKFLMSAIAGLLLFAATALQASWAPVSLEDFVKDKDLIVVGEVQRISHAPKSPRATDTAFIKVERILKSSIKDAAPKAGAEIPLSMPSINSEMKMSTDIHYKKGDRGIWILRQQDGKFHGGHPMALQPVTEESKVVDAIQGKKSK